MEMVSLDFLVWSLTWRRQGFDSPRDCQLSETVYRLTPPISSQNISLHFFLSRFSSGVHGEREKPVSQITGIVLIRKVNAVAISATRK